MFDIVNLQRMHLGPVSLSVGAGEIVALRGASGSGKTLLLRALADLDESDGEVRLNGTDCEDFMAPDWRRQVAWIPAEAGWWTEDVGAHFSDRGTALPLPAPLPRLRVFCCWMN